MSTSLPRVRDADGVVEGRMAMRLFRVRTLRARRLRLLLLLTLLVAGCCAVPGRYCTAWAAPAAAVTEDGTLNIVHQDLPGGKKVEQSILHTPAGKHLKLHGVLDRRFVNKKVRVRGQRHPDGGVQVESVTETAPTAKALVFATGPAVLSNTNGVKRVLVIPAAFSNAPDWKPWPIADLQKSFNTVSDFWKENSYGATSLVATITPWVTVAVASTNVCYADYYTYASQALAAAQALGYKTTDYDLFAFPMPTACGYNGMASVGGTYSWFPYPIVPVIAHELGHNLGLNHAGAVWAPGANGVGVPGDPQPLSVSEYGNSTDTMGSSSGHYSAPHKDALGWITSIAITAPGTYTLSCLETPGGTKAYRYNLKIGWDLYFEQRCPLGFDSFASPELFTGFMGVLLNTAADQSSYSPYAYYSYLLDMTPADQSFWINAAMKVGSTWTDPKPNGLTFAVQAITPTTATLLVTQGTTPPPPPGTTPPPPGTVPSTLTAVFLGADFDKVGTLGVGLDGKPDFHIALTGLRGTPKAVVIRDSSSGLWVYPFNGSNYYAVPVMSGPTTADLWFGQWALAAKQFKVTVTYADGTTDAADSTTGVVQPPSCVQSAPLATTTPPSSVIPPGATVSFTTAVTNRDSASCPAGTFTPSVQVSH